MAAVTRLGLYGGPRAPYAGFAPAPASAALSGTITTAVETDIVDGGQTVILTLTNDTWVASGATFNAQRQAIIDGLTSAGAEGGGWNAEVRDKELVGAVVRTSDTVVTITLTAAPAYDITAAETVTATIPAAALNGGVEVVAAPTVTIQPVVAVSTAATGGWIRRKPRYQPREETEEERRARILAARREMGILPQPVISLPTAAPVPAPATVLDEAELVRLMAALEATLDATRLAEVEDRLRARAEALGAELEALMAAEAAHRRRVVVALLLLTI